MDKARQNNARNLYFSEKVTQAMSGILHHPFTIVEAPMGYGKTTAVREYLNKNAAHVFWQIVYDNSPHSFWKEFSRLFAKLNKRSSQRLRQVSLADDSVFMNEALRIFEETKLSAQTVIVIDDYHLIASTAVNRFMEAMAKSSIINLHVVLIARFTDMKNREELTLKGFLHHITQKTFELLPKDIVEYYRVCGIRMKDCEADKLYALTEGWISALYLLLLEYIAGGGYSPEKSIYMLVEKAIYTPLSAEMKEFFLTLCIFDSFTREQAVYMWEKENTVELLTEITNKNAFVKYDGGSKTYNVHNIFTSFLKEMLDRKDVCRKNELYQKAARWFRQTGDYFAARRCFYECSDFDSILVTLEEEKSNDFTAVNKETLKKYLEECPREIKARHHYALLVYVMHLYVHHESVLFYKLCREFSENLEMDNRLNPEQRNRLLGELEVLLGFAEFNDLKKTAARYRKAWELLNQPATLYDAENWTFGSPSVLTLYYRESGKLAEHINDLKEVLPHYYRLTNGHGSGAEYAMEAEAHFNQGDFENAEILAHKALLKAQAGMDESIVFSAQYLKILIAFMQGDLSRVMETMRQMRAGMSRGREYDFVHVVEICEGCIYVYLDQKDKIPEKLLTDDIGNIRLRFPAFPFFHVMYGRLLLIQGEYLKLIGSAEHFIRVASVFQNQLGYVYTYIYLAAACYKIYREDEALANLKKAMYIAMPDRQFMLFAENCDYIEPLLRKIAAEGNYREEIREIIKLYHQFRKSKERMIQEYFVEKTPKLTKRELEIAQLAAAGLTNKEIGARLFTSENTIKTQLKSVFEKLDVPSRALLKMRLIELTENNVISPGG
ncbi:MAG TPA: LuxR C-terminal-related transcriptional regulator [Patescibacteria group bacterium]|nr:LuxR C-terminal-related transcriptional regulator [Patescibacteria group bacterium]